VDRDVKTIAAIHLRGTGNTGDLECGPERYFSFEPHRIQPVDTFHVIEKDPSQDVYMFGGGGMFTRRLIKAFQWSKDGDKPFIVWGAGLAKKTLQEPDEYPEWLDNALAVGVRDWDKGRRWVPCASCMSTDFDDLPTPRYRAVIYDHKDKHVPLHPTKVPRMDNFFHHDLRSVLEFLAHGEMVLTTSYHGVYWATLMGRRVVAWPWSTRFNYFKHPPLLGHDFEKDLQGHQSDEYIDYLFPKATPYPEALAECRQANLEFHKHVMSVLGE
jgi:hypothetical protein